MNNIKKINNIIKFLDSFFDDEKEIIAMKKDLQELIYLIKTKQYRKLNK